jgi:hypothetical protein
LEIFFASCAGIWLLAIGYYLYPIFPCMLFSLIASHLVARFGVQAAAGPAIMSAGACAGLTAIFRYEVGFFLLVANLFSLATLSYLSTPAETRLRRAFTTLFVYAAGASLVFVPVATVFLLVSPVHPFIADVVEYSAKYYVHTRQLPFPRFDSIWRSNGVNAVIYLPLFAVAAALPDVTRFAKRRLRPAASWSSDDTRVACLIAFASTAIMLFLKGIVRVSPLHMLLGVIPALVVLAVLTDLSLHRDFKMRVAALVVLLVAAVPTIGIAGSSSTIFVTTTIRSPTGSQRAPASSSRPRLN